MAPSRTAPDMAEDTDSSSADEGQAGQASGSSEDSSTPSATQGGRSSPEEEILSSAAQAALHGEDVKFPSDAATGQQTPPNAPIMAARAYQLEMFAESMNQNIIVVMDTGSGKTQIAILRMRKELEHMPPGKLIWFLAPTATLCEQQYDVIRCEIPFVQTKLLTGEVNFDAWSSKEVWANVLFNVRIVVSTHQILHDALSHMLVPLESIGLLVFDEAHRCIKDHPGALIMTKFYHENKRLGRTVPHVLGLTASPSISSSEKDIPALEATLDAMCKGPTIHRAELLARINRPKLAFASYDPGPPMYQCSTDSIRRLKDTYFNLPIKEDPYIIHLAALKTPESREKLRKAVMENDTFVRRQIQLLLRAARMAVSQLGSWASDYLIAGTTERLLSTADAGFPILYDWRAEEKLYFANVLKQLAVQYPAKDELALSPSVLSDKVLVLLKLLRDREPGTVGIIFADERVKVFLLARIIATHPWTKDKHKVGAVVGSSSFPTKQRALSELWAHDSDANSVLQNFRSGKINLLVATSVLEEGIDVPACNLILCFDKLPNLKSFIQRRGRARKKDSELLILREASTGLAKDWESLEAEVRRQYEDDTRERMRVLELESERADANEFVLRSKIGAFIVLDNARSHLDHFCSVLSPGEFVDSRPVYIFREIEEFGDVFLTARVILPLFIPENVRSAQGARAWKSEKNAMKDAAFQAYATLDKAGLLNDHLLPLTHDRDRDKIESRAPLGKVDKLLSPWSAVAKAWEEGALSRHTITVRDEHENVIGEYDMTLPAAVLPPPLITVYPQGQEAWRIEIGEATPCTSHSSEPNASDHTGILLSLAYGHRQKWPSDGRRHIVSFTARNSSLAPSQIGSRQIVHSLSEEELRSHLIRDQSSCPFYFNALLPRKPPMEEVRRPFYLYEEAPVDVPYVSLTKWSRRLDFLHPLGPQTGIPSPKPHQYVLPLSWAKMDGIPISHAHFGKLIPCILHELEVQLLATTLSDTVLKAVAISDIHLVRAAISSPSSQEVLNYERIELLGDSILKQCAVANVAALHPHHPERYLSFFKDKRVSNSYLWKACVETGLDKFILDKPFTGKKWQPLFVDTFLGSGAKKQPEKRNMATKTMADVVEALVGAAYIDGGMPKAMLCVSTLLPKYEWMSIDKCVAALYRAAPQNVHLPTSLATVEEMLGYSFRKKGLLLEAMTHGSYVGHTTASLERLEFIGDAIIDNVVITKLFAHEPPLPHWHIHRIKTAMVNGDFQAFLVMEMRASQAGTKVGYGDGDVEEMEFAQPLSGFLIHTSAMVSSKQKLCGEKHAGLRDGIVDALKNGADYPWALLSRLQVRKFYSDLFESLIGAVWVDSGSMEACEAVLSRFGLLGCMERIVQDGVNVTHPKEELGMLAVDRKVRYEIDIKDGEDGARRFLCQVYVGGVLKAEVEDGVDQEEVKTKAAEMAVRAMKEERELGAVGDAMDLN